MTNTANIGGGYVPASGNNGRKVSSLHWNNGIPCGGGMLHKSLYKAVIISILTAPQRTAFHPIYHKIFASNLLGTSTSASKTELCLARVSSFIHGLRPKATLSPTLYQRGLQRTIARLAGALAPLRWIRATSMDPSTSQGGFNGQSLILLGRNSHPRTTTSTPSLEIWKAEPCRT